MNGWQPGHQHQHHHPHPHTHHLGRGRGGREASRCQKPGLLGPGKVMGGGRRRRVLGGSPLVSSTASLSLSTAYFDLVFSRLIFSGKTSSTVKASLQILLPSRSHHALLCPLYGQWPKANSEKSLLDLLSYYVSPAITYKLPLGRQCPARVDIESWRSEK